MEPTLKELSEMMAAGDAAKHREKEAAAERIAALEVEVADVKKLAIDAQNIAVALHERLQEVEAAILMPKPNPPPR
jgi:hypothetical protein